jgi:glycosyltransferase involved in cell wall biosynthesis
MNFKDRINKALSTGTNTHKMKDIDFISFFKDNRLHPLRDIIMSEKNNLDNFLDSIISNIQTPDIISVKKSNDHGYFNKLFIVCKRILIYLTIDLIALIKISSRAILIKNKKFGKPQGYYKINIVDKYNQYKMFVVPEEIIGLPGIGFVEGMACGSAYIGIRDPMYSDLGMIDTIHYIGYDGTLEDLIEKIKYYQEHNDVLEQIALNGYKFVKQNFNDEKVMQDFVEYIELKKATKKNDKNNSLLSSTISRNS